MKIEIVTESVGGTYHYIVKAKKHWWSRWYCVFDGFFPLLLTKDVLAEMGIIKRT